MSYDYRPRVPPWTYLARVEQSAAFGEVLVAQPTPIAGWTFAYNVNVDLVKSTTTGSGTVTHSEGKALLNTTAATSSSASIETIRVARYIPGQGGLARFTAHFTEGVAGSTQIIGVGDASNGFFFGYNGAQFGVLRRRDGVDTWTSQDEWNVRQMHKTTEDLFQINPTLGNVYQIRYQWLGYGMVTFGVEDPRYGDFVPVHTIQYANSSVDTTVLNPTFPVYAYVANTTNATAITLGTPSAMAFTEGVVQEPAPPHPLVFTRTLTAAKTGVTTETNIITLKNQATWQTLANRISVQLTSLSVAVDVTGSSNVVLRLTKNTTLGGTPSYADVSANTSPVQYDTAGTTLTGGTVAFASTLISDDSRIVDLRPFGIVVYPGDIVTVSVAASNATASDVAVTWQELF
jgi:hypothetical protein